MPTEPKPSARIKAVRKALGMNQAEFSKALGVVQSLVSACEGGGKKPSIELYVRLGTFSANQNLSAEALWFLEQAGIDRSVIARFVRELGSPETPGDVVRIPGVRELGKAAPLPMPAELIKNPKSTQYLVIDRNTQSFGLAIGDVVVVDTSAIELEAIANRIAVVEYTPEDYGGPVLWLIGRVDFESHIHNSEVVVELTPVDDWRHRILQAPPVFASYRVKTGRMEGHAVDMSKMDLSKFRVDPRYRIRGRVIAWFRQDSTK